jgi:hypothetical protein
MVCNDTIAEHERFDISIIYFLIFCSVFFEQVTFLARNLPLNQLFILRLRKTFPTVCSQQLSVEFRLKFWSAQFLSTLNPFLL